MKTRSQKIWACARQLFGGLLDAPVPSAEDQARLVAELAAVQPGSSRDREIRNELALANLRLAIREFARRAYVPAGWEEEAVDEAVETLWKASTAFDPNAGTTFSAFVASQIYFAARRYSVRMRDSGADAAICVSLDSADDDNRVLSEVLAAEEKEDEDEAPRTPIGRLGLPLRETLVLALVSGREPADPIALRALRWALRERFGDCDFVPTLQLADACAVLGVSRRAVSDRLRSLLKPVESGEQLSLL